MPASAAVSSVGSDASRGFTKRASRIISNAALYDLVQDMAQVLDTELPAIKAQLAEILAILKGRD